MFAATLGTNKGTGQLGGWKIWSWLVWFMKGRHLGTNHAVALVKGERTAMVKDW
jgi:hypothetical protein